MHHHVGGSGVVELKDILNEFLLLLLDIAGLLADVHQLADILFGNPLVEGAELQTEDNYSGGQGHAAKGKGNDGDQGGGGQR